MKAKLVMLASSLIVRVVSADDLSTDMSGVAIEGEGEAEGVPTTKTTQTWREIIREYVNDRAFYQDLGFVMKRIVIPAIFVQFAVWAIVSLIVHFIYFEKCEKCTKCERCKRWLHCCKQIKGTCGTSCGCQSDCQCDPCKGCEYVLSTTLALVLFYVTLAVLGLLLYALTMI